MTLTFPRTNTPLDRLYGTPNEQRKKGNCPKLQQVWQGPCVITQKFSDFVYQIQLNKTGKTKIVHHDKLKPHHGENNITWIKHTQENIQINT